MPARLVGVAIIAAATVAPVWYWSGGLLELEATEFIENYLVERPLLALIFDPYKNDLGTYQARELSYFIDYLDAQVFGWLLGRDRPIFVPLSSIVAGLASSVVLARGARGYAVPTLTANLFSLVYFTSFVYLVTSGMFYRSAKPMLAPLIMAGTFLVLASLRDVSPDLTPLRTRRTAALAGVVAAASLLDRQGFFFAVLACLTLLYRDLAVGPRWKETAAIGGTVIIMVVYNVLLAPWLVELLNHYRPSLAFQSVPLGSLVDWRLMREGVRVMLIGVSLLFGAIPGWLAALILAVAAGYAAHRLPGDSGSNDSRRSWTTSKAGLLMIGIIASQVVMFTVMAYRHPPLYEHPDHARWYYPLPLQAFIITLGIPLLAAVLAGAGMVRTMAVNLVLVAAIAGNVSQWHYFELQQRNSHWFSLVFNQSRQLKLSIQDGRPSALRPGYLEFYELCLNRSAGLRDRAERAGSILR